MTPEEQAAAEAKAAAAATEKLGWRANLPEDMQEDETLARFKGEGGMIEMPISVAKSYLHSRSLVGADTYKMPVSEEDWKAHNLRFGQPESADLYELVIPQGLSPEMKEGIEDDAKWFRETVHTLGLSDTQATNLFAATMARREDKMGGMSKGLADAALNTEVQMRTEFGTGYEGHKILMDRALEKLGGSELAEILAVSGVYASPIFQRAMMKVGGMMAEDLGLDKTTGDLIMSKESLNEELNAIYANKAYLDGEHAEHLGLVAKAQALIKRIHGDEPVAAAAGAFTS